MTQLPLPAPPSGAAAEPRLTATPTPGRRTGALGRLWAAYRRERAGLAGLTVLVLIAAAALAAPLLTGGRSALSVVDAPGLPLSPPSWRFPLGTDPYGRSELALLAWGARVSLAVGLLATVLCVAIGTALGVLAGHLGGRTASVVMRVTDWFLVMPTLVLAIALTAVLSHSLATVVLAIAVTSWPRTARLVRAQTLAVEGRPYLERARALGAGHLHLTARHILPAVAPLVLAQSTLTVAGAILTESTLDFLGLGDPSSVSWGGMLQDARQAGAVSAGQWWTVLPPGLAIAVVALGFTLCGRAVEAALDPRRAGGEAR